MIFLRTLAAVGLGMSLLLPATAFAQINKPACSTEPCNASEVGPFLQGVSKKCGNVGDCELRDIEIAVANIGNWILGIIGSLVFAAYIYGGILWMTSGGGSEGVKKGKDAITKATTGLIIVFVAYAGVYSLKNALGLKAPGAVVGGAIVACDRTTIGQKCADNSVCVSRANQSLPPTCLTLCAMQNGNDYPFYSCTETASFSAAKRSACEAQKCDGGPTMLCCDERKFPPTSPTP